MLKSLFYIAVCALRAYHYYRVLFNPECVALEIRDLSGAFLIDAVFLSALWLLLFRLGEVRDALMLDEHGPFPAIAQAFWWTFLNFAIGGWIFSTAATHSACYTHAAEAKARAVSAAASTATAAPAAPAAVSYPPGTSASVGQKANTH